MRFIALFVLVAAYSLSTVAAIAKTVTTSPKNADEQSVNAVAGPPPPKKIASSEDKSSTHPSKKALKKTKTTPPPPLHDPN